MSFRPASSKRPRMLPVASALRTLLMLTHHSFALAPSLTLLALYGLSWRAGAHLGRWPQLGVDDPKFIAPTDRILVGLYSSVIPLLLWAIMGLVTVPLLTLLLRQIAPGRWLGVLGIVFGLAWLVLAVDPGARLTWFLD